jgi:hypothetical protein
MKKGIGFYDEVLIRRPRIGTLFPVLFLEGDLYAYKYVHIHFPLCRNTRRYMVPGIYKQNNLHVWPDLFLLCT